MDYEKLNTLSQSEITQDSGITRGIRDYIFWVRNKLWLVVLLTIVGIVLGIFVNSKSPDIYQATSSIEVERVERGDSLEDGNNNFRTEAFLGGDAIINTVTQKLLVPDVRGHNTGGAIGVRDLFAPDFCMYSHPQQSCSLSISINGIITGYVSQTIPFF